MSRDIEIGINHLSVVPRGMKEEKEDQEDEPSEEQIKTYAVVRDSN